MLQNDEHESFSLSLECGWKIKKDVRLETQSPAVELSCHYQMICHDCSGWCSTFMFGVFVRHVFNGIFPLYHVSNTANILLSYQEYPDALPCGAPLQVNGKKKDEPKVQYGCNMDLLYRGRLPIIRPLKIIDTLKICTVWLPKLLTMVFLVSVSYSSISYRRSVATLNDSSR